MDMEEGKKLLMSKKPQVMAKKAREMDMGEEKKLLMSKSQ